MTLTFVLLWRYAKHKKEFFSTLDRINLYWLRNITVLTFLVWLTVLFLHASPLFGGMILSPEIIALATSILVYIMGYMGLKQPEIFSMNFISNLPNGDLENGSLELIHSDVKKYEKSGLSSEKAKRVLQDLVGLMEKEKPFTDANLTLHELSEKLVISGHNLSEVINTQLKQNFFDFINHYRVEEVKKTLADPAKQHYTLLSIAYDAGFNSKSSFNSIFKKHTNMTPSQFKLKLESRTS
ncbi:helix-turn-helix transcriptional regulator [candidate division KSB1 bacterium]|nr:helix-turn-helix transcriptional regulator [candidate division KSB1 bacterium]